jgi:hypothetical protein
VRNSKNIATPYVMPTLIFLTMVFGRAQLKIFTLAATSTSVIHTYIYIQPYLFSTTRMDSEEEKRRVNELLWQDDLSDDSVIDCWSDPGARKSNVAPIAKKIVGVDKENANHDVFCEEEKCRVNELLSKDDLSDDSVIDCWSDPGDRKSNVAPITKKIVGVDKENANHDVF